MHRNLSLAVLAVAVLSACGPLAVSIAKPRPNVALAAQPHRLSLTLGTDVGDQYEIPPQQGIRAIAVSGWHTTLGTGFDSAFKDAFSGGKDMMTLTVDRADLVLMPTIIGSQGVSTVHAQLIYKARLLDASGKLVSTSAATVESKTTASAATQEELTRLAGDVVEGMYERIASELFATGG